ncbi:MAG: sigma-70 family RNA polymerase sigma factor [Planctomycetota bacterium JB042]
MPAPADDLTANARALRGLARHLCRDAATADDALQTAVVKALERPPRSAGSLRAWLARVVTNEARLVRRGDERRRHRERRVAVPEATSDAAALAARHEERVALVRAVRDLDEPYREVVLLRYFEGLPPRRIASRLGAPVKTVDSRLSRALSLLRGRLDARHGGDRRARALALAPLLARPSPLPLWTGVALMHVKSIAALLLVASAAAWWIADGRTRDPGRPAAVAPEAGAATPPPPASEPARAVERASAGPAAGGTAPAPPARPDPIPVTVVDPRGRPLPNVRVVAEPRFDAPSGATPVPAAVSDARGVVRIRPDTSAFTLRVDDPEHVGVLDAVLGELEGRPREPVVVAAGRTIVAGRVVDEAGAPIGEAQVAILLPEAARARLPFDLTRSQPREWKARTADDGAFRFDDAPAIDDLEVSAARAGLTTATVTPTAFPALALRLVLERPPRTAVLDGIVYGPDGAPYEGARVALGTTPDRSDAQGRFRFEVDAAAPPDRLTAVGHGLLPAVRERGDAPWPAVVELHLDRAALALAGVVRGADGAPLEGASVWIDEPTPLASWDGGFWTVENEILDRSELQLRATTDAEGRFRLEGLIDREYGLLAMDSARAWKIDGGRFRAGDGSVEIRFPDHGVHRRLAGRIVDRHGRPVAGARCQVSTLMLAARDPASKQEYYNVRVGSTATSAADGRFVLTDVPREGSTLDVTGGGVASEQSFPIPAAPPAELVLRVALRCELRIDRPAAASAAGFRLLDAAGDVVSCVRRTHGHIVHLRDVPLAEGCSELVATDDSVVVAVFVDAEGAELERVPVELRAGERTVVR